MSDVYVKRDEVIEEIRSSFDADSAVTAIKTLNTFYPETIFKRPCSNCENEDSINICDQCCFRYDSWFKKKEVEE